MREESTRMEASHTAFWPQDSRAIFVLNAWSLPLWLSSRNRARQRKITAYLKKYAFDYVLLQEMWCVSDVNWMVEALPEYQAFRSGGDGEPINKGGLVTLIKNAGKFKKTFSPFPKPETGNFEEKHSGKGVLLVTDGDGLTIGNSHLYSSGLEERHLTEGQFQIVLALAKTYPRLVMGADYNLPLERRMELNKALGKQFRIAVTDPTYDAVNNPLTQVGVNRVTGNRSEQSVIDGLMVAEHDVKLRYSDIVKKPLFSDHYGVIGLIALDPLFPPAQRSVSYLGYSFATLNRYT